MTFKEQKIIIMGTGGSGKTEFAKKLWNTFKTPVAYDINGDFEKLKGGIAVNPRSVKGDLVKFVNWVVNECPKKIDAIFFDDADAYWDYALMSEEILNDVTIRHRNKYKIALVFICKRPQNLPTKIIENAHTYRIFFMEGKNALDRIANLDQKIMPLLDDLKDFEHVLKEEKQPPKIIKAVKP